MSAEKKAIKEMAEVLETARIKALATIGSLNNGFGEWYAKALYEAGYRRVDENEIVVNKDQWQDLLDCDEALAKQFMRNCVLELALKKARKETAEKILSEVNDYFRPFDKKSPIFLDLLLTKLEMVAKKYGVEVE